MGFKSLVAILGLEKKSSYHNNKVITWMGKHIEGNMAHT